MQEIVKLKRTRFPSSWLKTNIRKLSSDTFQIARFFMNGTWNYEPTSMDCVAYIQSMKNCTLFNFNCMSKVDYDEVIYPRNSTCHSGFHEIESGYLRHVSSTLLDFLKDINPADRRDIENIRNARNFMRELDHCMDVSVSLRRKRSFRKLHQTSITEFLRPDKKLKSQRRGRWQLITDFYGVEPAPVDHRPIYACEAPVANRPSTTRVRLRQQLITKSCKPSITLVQNNPQAAIHTVPEAQPADRPSSESNRSKLCGIVSTDDEQCGQVVQPDKITQSVAIKRLKKELVRIRASNLSFFKEIDVDESNMLLWNGLLVPENAPYNKGAFKVCIKFPAGFPFQPPKIFFKTKIYHPNIDETGRVCLPIISPEHWAPATLMDHVILELMDLLNNPDPKHPLRADLADEFTKDREKFIEDADKFTKQFGEKRPKDNISSTVSVVS